MSHFDPLKGLLFALSISYQFSFALTQDCDCRKDPSAELVLTAQQVDEEFTVAQLPVTVRPIGDLGSDESVQKISGAIGKEAFSSVQNIYCGDGAATAFLACNGTTLVTNAHAIMTTTGQPKWAENSGEGEKSCDFFVENGDGTYSAYPIQKLSRKELIDNKQIGTPYTTSDRELADDWAVVKLDTPVPSNLAKPLRIGVPATRNQPIGLPMVLASARVDSLNRDPGSMPPRGYSVCTGTRHQMVESSRLLETNCKTEPGFSGSPLSAIQRGEPLVIAVHAKGESYDGKFGPRAVPTEKGFLEAIRKISGDSNCVVPLEGESRSASL
jgi:hypothetical protein